MAVIVPVAVGLRVVRGGVTQLVRSLAEAARSDPLTQLKNRLALDQEIDEQLEVARRGEGQLTVVVATSTTSSAVNDQLGHRAGDRALVRVARILRLHRRAGDTVARIGGEEFTLLLPNTSEHDAFLVAERMRRAVRRSSWTTRCRSRSASASRPSPTTARRRTQLIESADQALYAAKALGRNRSIIFNREVVAIFAPEAGGRGLDARRTCPRCSRWPRRSTSATRAPPQHSQTVGPLARADRRAARLRPDHVERVALAGTLHDIGKIGVPQRGPPEAGRRSAHEEMAAGAHAPRDRGARCSPGQGLEDLRSWVVAHHERPDGKGYPLGLTDAARSRSRRRSWPSRTPTRR